MSRLKLLSYLVVSVSLCLTDNFSVEGFSLFSRSPRRRASSPVLLSEKSSACESEVSDPIRRSSLTSIPAIFHAATFGTRWPSPALAADEQKVFKTGQPLGKEQAKARFQEARKSLKYLIDEYPEISKGGGDNVRRYLGTVGTTSGLYGIMKVLKELQEEADDIVEYTENMTEFGYCLNAADTSVYSANFVEFSAAKTKPEKFFEDARNEIERMEVYMDYMAKELQL